MGWFRRRESSEQGLVDHRQVAEWRDPGTGVVHRREMPEMHENGVLAARLMDALERIEALENAPRSQPGVWYIPDSLPLPQEWSNLRDEALKRFAEGLDLPRDLVSAGQSPAVSHRLHQDKVSDHEFSAYCLCGWISGDTSVTRARNRALRHVQRAAQEAGRTITVEIVP